MKKWASILLALGLNVAHAQSTSYVSASVQRAEAEYYVTEYSQHYGVSPELIRAVITQESNWNPRAVSNKGAMGYMQLMPKTASEYGVVDPFDPSQNIGGGVHYLADLIQEYRGDLRLVLAAYYCGSKRLVERGLGYSNHDVYLYVKQLRHRYELELLKSTASQRILVNQQISEQRTLEVEASQEGQQ